ncbi:putative phosphothreonine lyase domain-containg protein [Halovivax sp.]|uniref:putative phosphothreonine lyase domain-containing protein n=1 Tax=Halovivax sp. TaxID=1935978 RepID=UPI0025B829CC|nr:putative phosphothreonine lyase domain-containg protein [Halovivax sp.]
MNAVAPPSEITEAGTYWLRSRDVSDSQPIGDDDYFDRHDVVRPADVTTDDLPPADSEAVRELDRAAIERKKFIGKWQVTGTAAEIDALWPDVVDDAAEGILWAAKAMTAFGREELPYDEYQIAVYTPNYLDGDDVDRVRERLREAHDVTRELYYKPDLYTAEGMGPDNYEEWGLAMPARYRG